jgi:hypothetical protein
VKIKTDEAQRQLAGTATPQANEVTRQISERVKHELDDAKQALAEAKRRAEDARRQVDDVKNQTVEEVQRQVQESLRLESERQAKLAALTQTPGAISPAMDPLDLGRLLQAHLKRVGCDPGASDGKWEDGSRKALEQFNKSAGTTLDVKLASLDALDTVRGKTSRVCPLVCGKGQKAQNDRCVQVNCDDGFILSPAGGCVKKPAPQPKSVASGERPAAGAPTGSPRCFSFNGKRFCE